MQPSAPLPSSPFPSSPFPSSPPARPRVLVLGVGGIGGIAAAHLFEGGACDVVAVARSAPVREAVATHGFRLRGLERARAVPGRVDGEIPPGAFDFVILATQPPEVEAAAQAALPHLAPGGRLVCFQNGLCEERVARVVGDPGRVLGGVVAWGGNMVEPGVFERTSIGGFVLGRLDGGDEPALDVLARLLGPIGPVKRTPNLRGARWSKLAINCAISSLGTVAGVRLGELIQRRFARRFALEIFTECVEVARASGVRLEKVAGTLDVDWIALNAATRRGRISAARVRKHAIIYLVGLKFRRMRSSMLVALEKGRVPPVDFLNGEVVDRARALGLPAPANEAIRAAVWRLARGEARPGFDFLEQVFETVAKENGWR
jgi:2-dehydropantoate 2-reductase